MEQVIEEAGAVRGSPEKSKLDPAELEVVDSLDLRVWILGGAMALIGAVTAVLMLRDFQSNSYAYLAFYSIPANTAISVFPHEPVLIYFGKVANLWWAAAAASVGTLAAGWLDHRVFVPVLSHRSLQGYRENRFYRKAIVWFARWPFATLLVAGFSPVPFFPFKFLCFSMRYPMWRYLTALVIARFPRYYLLAWIGAVFFIPDWLLIGSFVFIIALYTVKAGPRLVRRIRNRREADALEVRA